MRDWTETEEYKKYKKAIDDNWKNNRSHKNYIDIRTMKQCKKTPETHHYSFDPYIKHISPLYQSTDIAIDSDRFECAFDKSDIRKAMELSGWRGGGNFFEMADLRQLTRFMNLLNKTNDNFIVTALVKGCYVYSGYDYWTVYYKKKK